MDPRSPTAGSEPTVGGVSMPRTILAVVAGWVLPGLGHVLLGRIRRGVVFAVIVLGSFAMGMAHDGRIALRDPHQPLLTTLQLVANVGVGPADIVARWLVYHAPAFALPGDTADPAYESRIEILRTRAHSEVSLFGTAYLWTAGLMNLLLLFDVWDIARGRKA